MRDDVADDAMDDELAADTPAFVNEGTEEDDVVIKGEDISAAEPITHDDVIDPAKNVVFVVKKAIIDTYTPKDSSQWHTRRLKLQIAIGPAGVDGNGKLKNKVFFPRYTVAVNRQGYPDAFSKPWYAPKTGGAFGEYNEFLKALGFSTSPAPDNNKAFRQGLVGRSFMGNVLKIHPRRRNADGKYVADNDSWENVIEQLRPVAAASVGAAAAGPAIAEE